MSLLSMLACKYRVSHPIVHWSPARRSLEIALVHVLGLLRLFVFSELEGMVDVGEDGAERVFVGHVEREERDHVEVLDLPRQWL